MYLYKHVLFFALVESHINYGILDWNDVNKIILDRLDTTQK